MLLLKPFTIKGTAREYTDLADQEDFFYRGLDHRLSNLRIKYNVNLDWSKRYACLTHYECCSNEMSNAILHTSSQS